MLVLSRDFEPIPFATCGNKSTIKLSSTCVSRTSDKPLSGDFTDGSGTVYRFRAQRSELMLCE